jgi:hypothetical protein
MKVLFILDISKGVNSYYGETPWEDNATHKAGDIVSCKTKKWKVTYAADIKQGCFAKSEMRYHSLRLEPIGHDTFPAVGDVLIKK